MRTNLYDSACDVCGVPVPSKQGVLIGPPWRVKCRPCSGEVEVPTTIKVTRDVSGEIQFEPSAYLGDRFGAYVSALKNNGALYNGKVNLAKVDRAPTCITALEAAGFILEVHPDVAAVLQAHVAQAKSNIAEASARALKVDAGLRERGLALYPFQKIGVEWLAGRTRALVGDDMGLGKTIQALTAVPEKAPVVVVGPLAAKGVWATETPKWRPDLLFSAVDRQDFHWPAAGEMAFVTYGSLPDVADLARFGKATEGTVLIADEAHKVKEFKSLRTKRFREMSEKVRQNAGKVWLLTGSPLLNDPPELWSILQAAALGRDAFGSYDNFCVEFDCQQDRWGVRTWGTPSANVASCLRKVMIRRRKLEVLPDLPAKVYRQIPVSIGPEFEKQLEKCMVQLRKYVPSVWDWIRAGAAAYEEGSPKPGATHPDPVVEDTEILAARNTLRGHDGGKFEELSHMRSLLATAKIPAMLNVVEEFEEQNEPLLVFSAHRAPIDTLGQRKGWAIITGDTSADERRTIAEAFQNGEYKGLGLTIDAGGVAITLTRAAQILFVDRAFTPALNDQAEDRAVRIGQTRGVIISTLVADHYLDLRLAEILAEKDRIIKASVEAAGIGAVEQPAALPGPEEIDFDKLAREREEKFHGLDEAKAEAERIAAERAKNAAELRAKLEKEAEEKKAKEKAQKNYERARAHAKAKGWVVEADDPQRRPAQTASERWAAQSLATLTSMDPDRAMVRNDVGFNKGDSYIGHWLTQEIVMGLTPNQWRLAINLCRPYHRQVGPCPSQRTGSEPPASGDNMTSEAT
jgi:hypothetical protein